MASFNRNWTLRYAQRKKRDEEAEGYFAWSLTDLLYRILFPFASLHLSIIIIISFQRFSVKIESRKKKKNTNFRYRTLSNPLYLFCTFFLWVLYNEAYQNDDKHMFLIWRFNRKPTWSWTVFEFTSHCACTRGTWFQRFLQFIFIILLFILHHPCLASTTRCSSYKKDTKTKHYTWTKPIDQALYDNKDRTLHTNKAIRTNFRENHSCEWL